jgi:cellulose synthase/poly-beta-1,6-N-acetylglucosamine synthase-like glycosyltransferase
MLTDWIHWLSQKHPDQLLGCLWALLLIDVPRYAMSKLGMVLWDCGCGCWRWLRGTALTDRFTHCPTVCVVVAAYNEADNIEPLLRSVWGSNPRLEIIVVDDGSSDGSEAVALKFARGHAEMKVLRLPQRSGKSPALNAALLYTKAEVIVGLDADAELGPRAIWEIVQPLADPRVGAVAGAVLGRNPFMNLLSWLQAYEFLHSVFVGRILSARLGLLGIASGAFTGFRRTALDQGFGWDEGSSADLDITLRLRKSGWDIAFSPYAECYTEMLLSWTALLNQRRRWDQSVLIRNHSRKHLDMACFWHRNFRMCNLVVLLESWCFGLFCLYGIFAWMIWFCLHFPPDGCFTLLCIYLSLVVVELLQILAALYYSNSPGRDALVCAVFPLAILLQLVLLAVRLVATTEELFFRSSYAQPFTPERVRRATWHW